EQDCGNDGAVDERRAEVRLQEDEEDRDEAEADSRERRARLAQAPRPLGEKAGKREHEQHLAELRRLKAEEAEVEPALRTADRTGQEHNRDHDSSAAEDHPPAQPVELRVDEQRSDESYGDDQ